MTTMQLEALKAEFAREILNEQDENLLKKAIAFFTKEKGAVVNNPPCRYTVEELRQHIDSSINSIRTGQVVTMEKLRAKHPKI